MTVKDIRQKYLQFMKDRGHAIIPPAPFVLANDPTTLFTSSGMQQLVPYLKGETHPMGSRIADVQPSIRVDDAYEVGDDRHTSFFEMLGNWSLGDYFKKEQLNWFYEFITKELNIDSSRLYVTVFAGNNQIPADNESIEIWQEIFNTKEPAKSGKEGFDQSIKIYTYDASKNWWSRGGVPSTMPIGEIGGPDSEVFFDFGEQHNLHENSVFKNEPCHVNCDCGRFFEIGNSVFMQYIKTGVDKFENLPKMNVDFGGGLERLAAAVNDNPDMFTIDLFKPLIDLISQETGVSYQQNRASIQVIIDHIRASTFMVGVGVRPSSKLHGYVLRQFIRRSLVKLHKLNPDADHKLLLQKIVRSVYESYQSQYFPDQDSDELVQPIIEEVDKFHRVLTQGIKRFNKYESISGKEAFDLLQSYGFPWELTLELAREKGQQINTAEFEAELKKHQDLSRTASAGMFKGGLADQSASVVGYHTATHLLHQALRDVLGEHVQQMGSNITGERLRFDFKHPAKLTDDQLQQVEATINTKISEDLPVHKTIESKDQALSSGALAFFRETYPDQVNVFTIGRDPASDWYSKELCGGPHVTSTSQIGPITIYKQESVGAGTRRLYLKSA